VHVNRALETIALFGLNLVQSINKPGFGFVT
jgi:hypothetical protein